MIRVMIDNKRIMFSEVWDERVKVQNDMYVQTYKYKQTNIPGFQLCYPCKCLAR